MEEQAAGGAGMSEDKARYGKINEYHGGGEIMEKNYKAKIKITAEKEVTIKAGSMGDAVRKFERVAEEIGAIDKWEIRTSKVKSVEEM